MRRFLATLIFCGALSLRASALPNAAEVIPTKNGAIRITPIFHGSLQIEYQGKVIHVDPFLQGDYEGAKKADLVLITHTHGDHLDVKAIENVRSYSNSASTTGFSAMVMPTVAAEAVSGKFRVRGANPIFVLANGQSKTINGISISAVPMYNLVRGPKPGQKFHPKGEFNGYILTLGGKRIYIAGDTEATPEMKALKNIDIAFLPMNLPYTMTPQEAAAGAKAFKPKVVYPYHYRFPFDKTNSNPQQFAKLLQGSGIQVKIRNWYAHPARKLIASP